MKTRYRSDISSGLVALIILVLLPCYALMIYLTLWIGLALLIIFTALIADTFVNTRYTIDETTPVGTERTLLSHPIRHRPHHRDCQNHQLGKCSGLFDEPHSPAIHQTPNHDSVTPPATSLYRPPAAHQSPHHRETTPVDIGQTSIIKTKYHPCINQSYQKLY